MGRKRSEMPRTYAPELDPSQEAPVAPGETFKPPSRPQGVQDAIEPNYNWREDITMAEERALLAPERDKLEGEAVVRVGGTGHFTESKKAVFLAAFAQFGRISHAADAADISTPTVIRARRADPEFEAAVQIAQIRYNDRVKEAVYEGGVIGIYEPIIGREYNSDGKPIKDKVVAYRRNLLPQLTILEAKRTDPEYRDKQQIDMNIRGGILEVPATLSAEEWEKRFSKPPKQLEPPNAE